MQYTQPQKQSCLSKVEGYVDLPARFRAELLSLCSACHTTLAELRAVFVAVLHVLILTTHSSLLCARSSKKEEGLSDNDLWEMQLHFPYSAIALLHPAELVHYSIRCYLF